MDIIVNEYGTSIRASGERFVLTFPKMKEKKEYPAIRVEKIRILRPASLTTAAVELALKHEVDIVYMDFRAIPIGRIFSSAPKGIASLRRAQLEVSTSPESFSIAKIFIKGKCTNQILHLRYLGYKYKKDFSTEILQCEAILKTVDTIPNHPKNRDQLMGIEGQIANTYFFALRKLIRFAGRDRKRGDKFNNIINYGYGFLYTEMERLCLYVGLDPYFGLCHTERYGKPALVCDLVEEFRVPVVDSVLFQLIIEKKMSKRSLFESIGKGKYKLSPEGIAIITEAILNRWEEKVIWKGKQYTLKQIMEDQVRSLARFFQGKEKTLKAFNATELFNLKNE
ncbi:MAG: CRISPR-associated endonuclease Cas1 [Patescibacteria group bacterium]